jgi:hypothetical protein
MQVHLVSYAGILVLQPSFSVIAMNPIMEMATLFLLECQ